MSRDNLETTGDESGFMLLPGKSALGTRLAAVVVSGSQKGNNLRVMALALIGPFDITAVSR